MAQLQISRSEGDLQIRFSSRLWTLFHDIPLLYDALLESFASEGLTASDLRAEAGDGSLGGFHVAFWLLGVKANVRIRVDNVMFSLSDLRVDRVRVIQNLQALITALQKATPGLTFAGHTASYGCHGFVENSSTKDFLARFFAVPPTTPETGPFLGSGLALYYGAVGNCITSSLTLDRSSLVQDGLFFKVVAIFDGQINDAAALVSTAEKHVISLGAAVGLQIPESV